MRAYIMCFGLLLGCSFHSGASGGGPAKIVLPDDSVAELSDSALGDSDAEVPQGLDAAQEADAQEEDAGLGDHDADLGAGRGEAGSSATSAGAGGDSGSWGIGGIDASDAAVQDALTFEGRNDGPGLFCDACESDADCGPRLLCLAQTICVPRRPTNGTCFDICPQTPTSSVSGDSSGAFCAPQGGGFTQATCNLGQDEQGRCEP